MSDQRGPEHPAAEDRVVPFKAPGDQAARTSDGSPARPPLPPEFGRLIERAVPADLAQADERCLADERSFKQRFWFATDEAGRWSILDLQSVTGLTDRQVTLLWWTGCLKLKGTDAYVVAEWWLVPVGVFFLNLAGLLMLVALLGALAYPPRLWHAPVLGFLELLFLGMGYAAYLTCIRPVQIRRRLKTLGHSAFLTDEPAPWLERLRAVFGRR